MASVGVVTYPKPSHHPIFKFQTKQTLTLNPPSSFRIRRPGIRAEATSNMATEKLGITIHTNPPESKLTELGIRNWPNFAGLLRSSDVPSSCCSLSTSILDKKIWGCPPSKFPWTYSAKETCYLLEGKVKVYPEGGDDFVEIGAGDLVVFPKGMSCTWDVSVAVDKHYKFE